MGIPGIALVAVAIHVLLYVWGIWAKSGREGLKTVLAFYIMLTLPALFLGRGEILGRLQELGYSLVGICGLVVGTTYLVPTIWLLVALLRREAPSLKANAIFLFVDVLILTPSLFLVLQLCI